MDDNHFSSDTREFRDSNALGVDTLFSARETLLKSIIVVRQSDSIVRQSCSYECFNYLLYIVETWNFRTCIPSRQLRLKRRRPLIATDNYEAPIRGNNSGRIHCHNITVINRYSVTTARVIGATIIIRYKKYCIIFFFFLMLPITVELKSVQNIYSLEPTIW